MSTRSTARAFARSLDQDWLAAVDRAEKYVPIRDRGELPPQALASSCYWCAAFFPSCADPHDAALSAEISAHVATADTPDLLRYAYVVNGVPVDLLESRNFALLRVARASVDVLALPPAERAKEIQRIAAAIFSSVDRQQAWSFVLPKKIEEGTTFCTDPSANPLLLATWSERIDGGIHHGSLYFLCYKRVAQIVGFWNAQEWFDEAFRAKHRG
jgi:hypothetical protein